MDEDIKQIVEYHTKKKEQAIKEGEKVILEILQDLENNYN